MFSNSPRLGRLILIVSVLLSGLVTGAVASPLSAIPPEPVNDNIADAIVLDPSASPRTVTGTNVEATFEAGESLLADDLWASTQNSVWYSLVAPVGMVEIDTDGSDFDTVLAVFQFSSVNGFANPNLMVINDDRYNSRTSKVAFEADGTSTYYIAVAGFSSSSGSITLNWSYPPAATNDNIANAIQLNPVGETRQSLNNYLATTAADEMTYMTSQGLHDAWTRSVWFKVQPLAGHFGVRLEGHVSAQIMAIDSSNFSNIVMMTFSANGISFEADGLTTYYIGVSGSSNGVEQSFDLVAERLTLLNVVQDVEVVSGETTVVTWNPPSGFDSTIHRYQTLFSNGTIERGCSPATTGRCEFVRMPPGTWTLDVVAYDSRYGFYGVYYVDNNVQLTHVSNDTFANAVTLSSGSGQLNDYFDGATLESGEPAHAATPAFSSLWYSYTSPTSGTSSFAVATRDVEMSGELSPTIAIYRGSQLSSLVQLSSATGSVSFDVIAGQRYYVVAVSERDFSEWGWIPGGENQYTLTWSHVAAPPETAAPTTTTVPPPQITIVKAKNNATMASILKKAKIKVPKNAKVTYIIAKASKKKCSVARSRIQLKKKITCEMTVKIKPKKGASMSHRLNIQS